MEVLVMQKGFRLWHFFLMAAVFALLIWDFFQGSTGETEFYDFSEENFIKNPEISDEESFSNQKSAIKSVADGVVKKIKKFPSLKGFPMVSISHTPDEVTAYSEYFELKNVRVTVGKKVHKGEIIGYAESQGDYK